ncbi:PAS domain S-box protein [Marinilabilia sp.]|uniref:PAS domain S-box protein n=1 Tax=Marinilabilia sp. TaxID=2021252 RepID=UPI0025C0B686|nr:PAS domain S-box protein [Marinilabilia sp.]
MIGISVENLFHTLPTGVIYFDGRGDLIAANPAAEELLGFGLVDLKRQGRSDSFWRLLAEDGSDLPVDRHPSRIALKTGRPVKDKVVGYFHPSKRTYSWLNLNAVPLFEDGTDKSSSVYVTIHDVTTDVGARNKLRQTQTDYQVLVDNMHSGVVIIHDGKVLFLNKSMADHLGRSIEELKDTPFIIHIAPEEQERIQEYYVKRLAGLEVPESYRTRIIDNKGGRTWVDFKIKKLEYRGKPTLLVLINDVDAEVRTEEKLKSSELRFRRLFEEAPIGIALVGDNGKPLEVNDHLSRIIGYPRNDLLQMTFADYSHPEDLDKDLALFEELKAGKRESYEMLKRYVRQDGQIVWGELKVGSFVDGKGKRQIIGMFEDRTMEVNTQKELEIARDMANEGSRLKSAFLASVSHELRTPLNAVLGFSDIIKSTSENPNIIEYSGFIYEAGFKVMTIIDDILELAMSEHGKIRVRPASFRIGDLFDEFRRQLQEVVYKFGKDESVNVLTEIEDHLRDLEIVTDKSKVYQVIVNLVKNAVKFTEKGFVKLGCFQTLENRIAFFIQDSGIGISDDQKEVIFDFFRQADGHDHAKYGGIGIGLAISKRVANAMLGDIKVESVPGEGTIFTLVIPMDLGEEISTNGEAIHP